MDGLTNYISLEMRRCLNCWNVCEKQFNRCTQCNYLFYKEATEQDIKNAKKGKTIE